MYSMTIYVIMVIDEEGLDVPRAFSEDERQAIRERLLDVGEEYWGKLGLRRTSVDDLAKASGISKGTFYLFFETKEHFFAAVLERCHARIETEMLRALQLAEGSPRERFVTVVMRLFAQVQQTPWLVSLLCEDGEYQQLMRRVPSGWLPEHIRGDDEQAEQLLRLFDLDARVSAGDLSAALRGLFLLLLHRQEIGPDRFEGAWQLLVEGLALRLFGGVA